jgi:membrane fusion protein (multidrug efflux system)
MSRRTRTATLVALGALALLAGWRLRPSPAPAQAQTAGPGAPGTQTGPRAPGAPGAARGPRGGAGGGAPLLAEGYTVRMVTVRETVPTLGTLLPNESVNIVAESSRRVVGIHVAEGSLVQKGALLFKLDDAALRADLMRLEGRHALAEANEARLAALVAQKLVSQQDYDRARSELTAIVGEMEVLKVAIGQTSIRAPFTGRVGLRRVSLGAYVNTNTILTTLQDLSQLKLDFTLPERYSTEVRPGQSFNFTVEGRAGTYSGRVVALEPGIDTATRSLVVRGVVPNPGGQLTPGASASVRFEVGTANGILIPSRALVPSIKGHSVFVLRDGKAAEQEVTIGTRTADSVQILSGLRPGEVLLTSNLLRLRAGIPVRLEVQASEEGLP